MGKSNTYDADSISVLEGWRLYAKDLECILEVSRQKDSTI